MTGGFNCSFALTGETEVVPSVKCALLECKYIHFICQFEKGDFFRALLCCSPQFITCKSICFLFLPSAML